MKYTNVILTIFIGCMVLLLSTDLKQCMPDTAKVDQLVESEIGREGTPLRIFCLLTTCPQYHETRARAVMNTWGKRCTYIYFVTTKPDTNETTDLPLLYAPFQESYIMSWGKVKLGMRFAHKNFLDKFDWFVKMDDDSYLIVENLLTFLEDKNTNEPIWYGRELNLIPIVKQGFMSGGSGYALSKKGFQLVVEKAFDNATICDQSDVDNEDWQLGRCLENVGVKMGNTIEQDGETFHTHHPETSLHNFVDDGVSKTKKIGLDCCSRKAISWHYMTPTKMLEMEYMLYKLKLAELPYSPQNLNHKIPESFVNEVNKQQESN